jgi:hypothetical protein
LQEEAFQLLLIFLLLLVADLVVLAVLMVDLVAAGVLAVIDQALLGIHQAVEQAQKPKLHLFRLRFTQLPLAQGLLQ